MAAESTTVKNARDGTIAIINTTRTYTVSVEQGNFAVSGANEGNYETTVVEDRGEFSHLRRTKRKYPTGTFTAFMRDLTDATDPTLVGMCLKRGLHAADVSITGSSAEVYMVDILWTVAGTTHGDPANHTVLYEDCRIESCDFSEAEDKNLVSIAFTCHGAITYT
jgi:hypothetical protein